MDGPGHWDGDNRSVDSSLPLGVLVSTPWPEYGHALSVSPSMSVLLGSMMEILAGVAGALLLLAALERLREGRRPWAAAPVLLLVGLTVAPNPPGSSWLIWIGVALAVGVGVALLWLLCRTLGWAILPGVVGVPILMEHWELLQMRPFLGSGVGGVMGILAVLVVVRYWTKALQAPSSFTGRREMSFRYSRARRVTFPSRARPDPRYTSKPFRSRRRRPRREGRDHVFP